MPILLTIMIAVVRASLAQIDDEIKTVAAVFLAEAVTEPAEPLEAAVAGDLDEILEALWGARPALLEAMSELQRAAVAQRLEAVYLAHGWPLPSPPSAT